MACVGSIIYHVQLCFGKSSGPEVSFLSVHLCWSLVQVCIASTGPEKSLAFAEDDVLLICSCQWSRLGQLTVLWVLRVTAMQSSRCSRITALFHPPTSQVLPRTWVQAAEGPPRGFPGWDADRPFRKTKLLNASCGAFWVSLVYRCGVSLQVFETSWTRCWAWIHRGSLLYSSLCP